MNMLVEEPPYLFEGTDVSAKYKGAFCEAKIRKVEKLVKCKIAFKQGFGSHTVLDNHVKGLLKVGASVEARHPEKKDMVKGSIIKIQDCSQYTVVFDDGDITTLRRSALCLKSGRHFAEGETLDQLPLTHPEHFGNPVFGSRRGGRRRLGDESSDGELESHRRGKPKEERETEIGKVVCVELGDKKKVKDNWFPGLVVAPKAQDTVHIRVKEEYLVRSFKDGRYYTVPKKEATEFTREVGSKVDNATLKGAVDKALTFLEKDELPPHWDRDLLFGLLDSEDDDSDGGFDSDSSDNEPREEKDHFVAQLYKFMDDRGTPINSCPSVCSKDLDLYKLFNIVNKLNGYNRVSNQNQWKLVSSKIGLGTSFGVVSQVKHAYKKYLHSFEDFHKKLGCTMVNHPWLGSRTRNRSGRSLIRDKHRSTPVSLKGEDASVLVEKEKEPVLVPVRTPATKKLPIKEEDVKPSTSVLETKEIKESKNERLSQETTPTTENEPIRPISSLRKKFPSLKASPRTKEAEGSPATTSGRRTPITRPKRLIRENSTDEDTKAPEEQRSTTRAKSKEDSLKQSSKKEPPPEPRRGKSSSKSSDSDSSKRTPKPQTPEIEKKIAKLPGDEAEKKVKVRTGSETSDGGKRILKRPNMDGASLEDIKSRPCLPRTKSVFVGDVLNVYYGSPSDVNAIYEAKVVDVEEDESGQQMFLVHYAGWNSRYDEWIKRNKIAENLSWTARRAKPSPDKVVKPVSQTKKKTVGGKSETGRSTTPSSITSSSSRTKSPATPVSMGNRRSARRAQPNLAQPRRTRRLSGHTDISVDSQSESESESVVSDSESESKSIKKEEPPLDSVKAKDVKKMETRTPLKRKPAKKFLDDATTSAEPTEKKKPRFTKQPSVVVDVEKDESLDGFSPKTVGTDEKMDNIDVESPKGRDFDLNEIRSEMKGISKPVKVSAKLSSTATETETTAESNTVFEDSDKDKDTVEIKSEVVEESPTIDNVENLPKENDDGKDEDEEISSKAESNDEIAPKEEDPESIPVLPSEVPEVLSVKEEKEGGENILMATEMDRKFDELKEDIYEFKEPEPFDYQEVRRHIRIIDEVIERSPEKSIPVKKVNVAGSPMRASFEKKEGTSLETEIIKRFRKFTAKSSKDDDTSEGLKIVQTAPLVPEVADMEEPSSSSPPPLIQPSVFEDDDEGKIECVDKSSPEPPCLVPVTESRFGRAPEHSPVLTREVPPRLDGDESSTDSECNERLIIANDEESTSNEVKMELVVLSSPPRIASPVEEKKEVKRSPLAELRLKRVEERRKSPLSPLEPIPQKKLVTSLLPVDDEVDVDKKEPVVDEGENRMRSLLCDEVIPGSPAPKDPGEELSFAAPTVIDNTPPTTPPTTPESNVSSPRGDHVGSSLDNESLKSLHDSSERDLENEGLQSRGLKFRKRSEKEASESPNKKRRCRKRSESTSETGKRLVGRSRMRGRDPTASDSDDGAKRLGRNLTSRTSDSDEVGKRGRGKRAHDGSDSEDGGKRLTVGRRKHRESLHSYSDDSSADENEGTRNLPDPLFSNRSPRPSKYNFCKEIPSDLDACQRISYIQHQMQELRKAYMHVKGQLASIDRRRKKLRRKEREEKAEKAAAAAAAVVAAAAASAIPSTSSCKTTQVMCL